MNNLREVKDDLLKEWIEYREEISVKKFRMKILEIIIDTINRYSKLRDFSLSFVLS